MNEELLHSAKIRTLEEIIGRYPSALIAFSGGVDSTLLAYICKKVLGQKALLVTAVSPTYSQRELEESRGISAFIGLPHLLIESEELDIADFVTNTRNRCYYCKRELFKKLNTIAKTKGIAVVFDGNNVSDMEDFRPGRVVARELGVISPLADAGLTKSEVRALSHEYGLPNADKPAMACLASRFPYGETITREKLSRVEWAEQELRVLGFSQLRVRSHNDLARIEFAENELDRAFAQRTTIIDILKKTGFVFQCIDLQGYRTGSMNEELIET